jgi:3-hydroxyisobutyrate dehydrogenase-like beta-hydroxyacid dehydrogenase
VRVGFIGLGTMGAHMAANLRAAAHHLVVHDIRADVAAPLLDAGATWAANPAEVGAQCDVVFTSLPGPVEVEAVALGRLGLREAMAEGTAWFDLSTNSPTLVRHLHTLFAEQAVHVLDAPVSGGPRGAHSGRLAIWVGGDESVFEAHLTLLRAIGDQPRHVGPIGAGSVAKLVHNCAGYVIQTALAEVFTLGVKAGVDPLALFAAVRHGAGGRRRTFDGLVDQFLPGRYDPPTFALALAHKDVSLALELGREHGVPMRLASLTLDELTEALGRGWAGRDSRVAMLLQQERAAVAVEVDDDAIARVLADDPPVQ